MKANDAPEKIYLQVCGDCPQTDCNNCKFEDLEDNITWCKDKIFKNDIEYVRKDAFIEKAMKYLYDYNQNMVKKHGAKALLGCGEFTINVDEFIKYMKGE